MKARLALAALALAGVASLSAASAHAAAPQQTVLPINDTFTVTDICPFPIVEHAEGTLRIIEFVDENGSSTRELDITPGLRVSFSANGVTLTTVSPSVGHAIFNDDSATLMITGLSGHISIPGQGTLALSAGRILAIITDDDFQIVAVNGTFSFGFGEFGPIEAQLCAALA
jgi:hypothetical protein